MQEGGEGDFEAGGAGGREAGVDVGVGRGVWGGLDWRVGLVSLGVVVGERGLAGVWEGKDWREVGGGEEGQCVTHLFVGYWDELFWVAGVAEGRGDVHCGRHVCRCSQTVVGVNCSS